MTISRDHLRSRHPDERDQGPNEHHYSSLKAEMDKNAGQQQQLMEMSQKMIKMQSIAFDHVSNFQM
ncbi:hypothetical protein MVEG_09688 [Podila verticillata NRRL 6337]|nr:hypothetical protein MVEG_09688 [Podila verticillata NRRL 6337]